MARPKHFGIAKILPQAEFTSAEEEKIMGSPRNLFRGAMQLVKTIVIKGKMVSLVVKPQ